MPNCDFYAARTDFSSVLKYVFDCGDFDIYEMYSKFEKELQQFSSANDILRYYQIVRWEDGLKRDLHLQLYPRKAQGKLSLERVSLNPQTCNGATYRYKINGWGAIQLYLGAENHDEIRNSHTNHNSERRAAAYAWLYPSYGEVSAWDWGEVVRCSRKLNYHIQKLAIDKAGSRHILPDAKALLSAGLNMYGLS